MSILYAKKVLDNASEIIELSSLILDLRDALVKKYPTVNQETLDWALQQAIARLSLRVGQDYVPSSTRTDHGSLQELYVDLPDPTGH